MAEPNRSQPAEAIAREGSAGVKRSPREEGAEGFSESPSLFSNQIEPIKAGPATRII